MMNIQLFLQQISASGMSDEEIGKEIGAAASIVNRLRNGIHKTTSYERGMKICALHKRKVKKAA